MPFRIIVLVKQVIDPEMPISAFQVDEGLQDVVTPPHVPPVLNGFDENAVEAALRIKDRQEAEITVVSLGQSFALDVIKKPLSMGCDNLVLVEDPSLSNTIDSTLTASLLASTVRKLGIPDLILCGRQASDWDNAQVPLMIAEFLNLPCITVAKHLEVAENLIVVQKHTPEGTYVLECPLPALVTVSNELGQPRYPTLRGIMAATRKQPTTWMTNDLDVASSDLEPRLKITDLYVPSTGGDCQFITGENEAEAGRLLALKLREAKLL